MDVLEHDASDGGTRDAGAQSRTAQKPANQKFEEVWFVPAAD